MVEEDYSVPPHHMKTTSGLNKSPVIETLDSSTNLEVPLFEETGNVKDEFLVCTWRSLTMKLVKQYAC